MIYHFLCNIGAFVGGVLLPLTAWGVSYWRNLLRVIYSPAFLFSTYYFLIDESPRWLLTKGKKDKAIAILEKMGHKNKVKLDKNALDKLLAEDKDNNIGFVSLLKMTFQSSILLKRCMVCVIWWTSSTFVYHGMMINSVSLQGNKYINFGLTQLVLLAGSFMIMFVLHNYKRRNPLICSFFAGALLCFVQPFLPTGKWRESILVYIVKKI